MNHSTLKFFACVGMVLLTTVGGIFAVTKLLRIRPPSPDALVVSQDGRGQYTTISGAIKNADPGMKILVRPGVYRESVVINKPLEIVGLAREDTYLNRVTRVFLDALHIKRSDEKDVVIESVDSSALTMETGSAHIQGITLRTTAYNPSSTFPLDSSLGLPAVDIPTGRLTIEECDITSASGIGVAIYGEGTNPSIRASQIHACRQVGIYITSKGSGVINSCEIFNNGSVGISVTEHSAPSIELCDLYANNYDISISTGADPTIKRSVLHDGRTCGLFIDAYGKGTIEDTEIYGHREAQEVLIRARSQPTIRRCKIHDGKHEGIYFYDHAEGLVEDCDLYENYNTGVIISDRSDPTIRRCKFHNMSHGGILVKAHGAGTIEDCDIRNHSCMGILVIEHSGPTIRNCTIKQNDEGAIVVRQNGGGSVENCDLRENKSGGLLVAPDSLVRGIGNKE